MIDSFYGYDHKDCATCDGFRMIWLPSGKLGFCGERGPRVEVAAYEWDPEQEDLAFL